VLTESFSSSIFVGAEDANAEKVPFKGMIEQNLLLHFWPIASLIYVPRIASPEKTVEQTWRIKREDCGYVLTIPEPCNVKEFHQDCKGLLRMLDSQAAGFRPRSALIDLYEEGGLEYLYHFGKEKISQTEDLSLSLGAVELYHLQKQGNRIRQLSAERILPNKRMLRDYEILRKDSNNPFYKSIRIRNLLDGRRWYERADDVFYRYPMSVFVYSRDKTPKGIRFFGNDVKKQFTFIEYEIKEGGIMSEDDRDNQLSLRIYQLVRTYVNLKTEEKSGKRYKDFQSLRDEKKRILYPQEYRDAREKVCNDAFLAMRGRRDQDFIEYFTGTICSVPQYMAEGDFIAVAGVLMKDWEKIKVLSMLALSAHSYLSQPTEQQEGEL
ncbi:MAG: type I-MYXAN CRISPR-associated protein Cmx8, partial [Syntrophobacteraceae bacterium]